jgi:predicted ATPase
VRSPASPYQERLYQALDVQWLSEPVPGAYFDSQLFRNFARIVDEWAAGDPGVLDYFGGKSLLQQSHGQSLMAYFQSRFSIRGLYLLDEPETALSPRSQLALLKLLRESAHGQLAQFIIATHSPILLACPEAQILSFDHAPLRSVAYEDTDAYRVYKAFMDDRSTFL